MAGDGRVSPAGSTCSRGEPRFQVTPRPPPLPVGPGRLLRASGRLPPGLWVRRQDVWAPSREPGKSGWTAIVVSRFPSGDISRVTDRGCSGSRGRRGLVKQRPRLSRKDYLSIQLVLEPQQSLILVVKDELEAKASPRHSVRSDASDQGQLRDLTHSDPAQDRE